MDPLSFSDGTVFSERRSIYTLSAAPGHRTYGEKTPVVDGKEYREWNPRRSKLAAYIVNGGTTMPIHRDSKVLYLGASSGTTPSHVSDIVSEGKVFCVEFAPRMFRELVNNSSPRPNMMPILGDATKPSEYAFMVDKVDIVYEDVAQKGQADILVDNMEMFGARYGMVAVKARSEDVTEAPKAIFRKAEARLKERGCRILDARSLEPFEDSHEMIVVERI
ncbi:MAG: fibrillarin-like rRNA/tRNA 2'-O-methyltransferase [archaeon]|nr:fibrillarin-like rRNA/tRNA 2'-O-methyltransferase [archaeon]